jgi:hypothetical protein
LLSQPFPAWWLTADPLWAVVLLTSADLIGFGPTYTRAYHHSHQEAAGFFALGALRKVLIVLALEHYSLRAPRFIDLAVAVALTTVKVELRSYGSGRRLSRVPTARPGGV